MKNILYFVAVLLLSCLSSQGQTAFIVSLDSLEDGAEIYLSKEQLLQVKVYSNPSTGYRWEVAYDKKEMELTEQKYVSDPVPEGWVGVGGYMFFTFKNKYKGKSSLTFSHLGPSGNRGVTKKIYIVSSKLNTTKLLGRWFQTQHQEMVVRDGDKYPHQENYVKGDRSFTFKSNKTGVCQYKNMETGLFEEIRFKWSLNKHLLVINYVVGKNVQEPRLEEYTITLQTKGLILESLEKDDDTNYIYNKLILAN